MAEEEKKPAEKAPEREGKDADGNGGSEGAREKEGEKASKPPSPPPEEVVMKVDMHCEGCARKVRKSLRGFPGVEEVVADSRTHRVVVKGRKAAEDPMKVVARVQKKSGRKVELLSPLPPQLPPPSPEKEEEKAEEMPKAEEKKEEQEIINAVVRVYMHCEGCAHEIKRRILRMKGVESAEPDLRTSEVMVKGAFDPIDLTAYVVKRTGKQAAVVVKQEPVEKKPEMAKGEESPAELAKHGTGGNTKQQEEASKKTNGGGGECEKKDDGKDEKEKKADQGGTEARPVEAAAPAAEGGGGGKKVRNELYYCYPRYLVDQHAYPPQIFSDENPNACAAM